MTRQIFAAEINFQDTPVIVREKFNDSEKNVKRLLLAFRRRVEEVYIFANRQRFTVYIVHHDMAPLTEFFHEEHHLKGYIQYYYNAGECVTHLMATAGGLLSPVKGEAKVLSELSRCSHWAKSCACIGVTLDTAVRRALDAAKSIRTETGIDKFCSSIVETGIELLYTRLRDVHRINFLIVGTGELARQALSSLTLEGITNIAITGTNTGQVTTLAKKYGVRSISIESLPGHFAHADVVIGAFHQELEKAWLPDLKAGGLADKGSRVILDLGMPPNFDPETVGMFAEEFYNLDDLRRLQPSLLESFGGVEAAWRMVLKAANEFVTLLQLLHQSPVLSAYLTRQFAIKNTEHKARPKRTIRTMLSFKKNDNLLSAPPVKDRVDMRVQLKNHLAENAADVVRNVQSVKQFAYLLTDN